MCSISMDEVACNRVRRASNQVGDIKSESGCDERPWFCDPQFADLLHGSSTTWCHDEKRMAGWSNWVGVQQFNAGIFLRLLLPRHVHF